MWFSYCHLMSCWNFLILGGSSCLEIDCDARGLKTMSGMDWMMPVEQLDAGREYLAGCNP
jgi:hypothetical protein